MGTQKKEKQSLQTLHLESKLNSNFKNDPIGSYTNLPFANYRRKKNEKNKLTYKYHDNDRMQL